MKKVLFLFAMIISSFIFSQNIPQPKISSVPKPSNFTFINGVMTEYSITDIPNTKKEIIYSKINGWIKKNYANPNAVIISKIDNEYIRFKGFVDNLIEFEYTSAPGKDNVGVFYEMSITVKDNKYKLAIERITATKKRMTDLDLLLPLKEFDNDGPLHINSTLLPSYFNVINNNIKDYIINSENKEDW